MAENVDIQIERVEVTVNDGPTEVLTIGIAGPQGNPGPASTVPGPQGEPGPAGQDSTVPGPAGEPGTQIFTGTGAPDIVSGALTGDLYLNTSTGDLYRLT